MWLVDDAISAADAQFRPSYELSIVFAAAV